jgi:hypothetical protein
MLMFSKEKSDRPTIEQSVQKRTQRAKCNQVSENEFLVGTGIGLDSQYQSSDRCECHDPRQEKEKDPCTLSSSGLAEPE